MRGTILRGTGPAPEGYTGPCDCDPELGSHFHAYTPKLMPKRPGDYVAGARIEEGAARPVLACGCTDHTPGRVFYSSARNDQGAHVALSGPYETHTEALAAIERDQAWAYDVDPKAPWYAYGTFAAGRDYPVKVARS